MPNSYSYQDFLKFFKNTPIKDQIEIEKILSTVLSLLCYLEVGGKVTTPFAIFEKMSSDLIYIHHKKNQSIILDELEKNNIVKI